MARPRQTHDIDVFLRPGDVEGALDLLEADGFETSVHDPAWLAKAFKRRVLVDLIFRSSGEIYLDDEMLERSERRDYKGVSARVISAEDLLVIKALATGETTAHHWYDALALIAKCDLDWDYLVRRANQAGPRRVLSLLIYAESCDLAVPTAGDHRDPRDRPRRRGRHERSDHRRQPRVPRRAGAPGGDHRSAHHRAGRAGPGHRHRAVPPR